MSIKVQTKMSATFEAFNMGSDIRVEINHEVAEVTTERCFSIHQHSDEPFIVAAFRAFETLAIEYETEWFIEDSCHSNNVSITAFDGNRVSNAVVISMGRDVNISTLPLLKHIVNQQKKGMSKVHILYSHGLFMAFELPMNLSVLESELHRIVRSRLNDNL
ncbi:hypothetical protein [Shewanella sp. UCD-KL12]|uniref:hypothetical protein n=1 Tax=Shewanella sp. UCD-KL12 TaxID=1917163 RepID=UPI000971417B|nr:hypothetical protein [Shewanella sp. UCD-KL12]